MQRVKVGEIVNRWGETVSVYEWQFREVSEEEKETIRELIELAAEEVATEG